MSELKFSPFSSCVSPGFWSSFSKMKLEVLKLDEAPLKAAGCFSNSNHQNIPQSVNLDWDSFAKDGTGSLAWNMHTMTGDVCNLNTLDDFKALDKTTFLKEKADIIWKNIVEGNGLEDPDTVIKFSVLMFADLKKYHFYYWFTFPSLALPSEVKVKGSPISIDEALPSLPSDLLASSYREWKKNHPASVFCIQVDGQDGEPAFKTFKDGMKEPNSVLCFADASNVSLVPATSLRNIIWLAACHFPERLNQGLKILCLRQHTDQGKVVLNRSYVIEVVAPKLALDETPMCFGWELNDKGKPGPRFSNMASAMDPKHLAASSVDLNLKLMKWRMAPSLDLDAFASVKCLLLGSGTLGCNVARGLLGWGVRHITMVDNGKVSYSNPVRQSLFNFEDCLNGGKPKALAAAEGLKRIFPFVVADGIRLHVPLPGQVVSPTTETEVKDNYDRLEGLIRTHDVIFLLMDTRESRWLPTVMAAHHGKLVINAALGFDTYLVMRHGMKKRRSTEESTSGNLVRGPDLGCYFCNDVVAPGDSTKDRTLDQQCTVTRPGVSGVAGALAVELMASVLQHEEGPAAPAPKSTTLTEKERTVAASVLGTTVPHSIRGSVHTLDKFLPTTEAFRHCTACGPPVLDRFDADGWSFFRTVTQKPGYLEELTGLSNLLADIKLDNVEVDFSDDDDF